MRLSKVEIGNGLTHYYENFAGDNLIKRHDEIKNMDEKQFFDFIQDIVYLGNGVIRNMRCYVRRELGIDIISDKFELKSYIEERGNISYTIITGIESQSTMLKIPIKIYGFCTDKITLSQCLCAFIETNMRNYYNCLCACIDITL